MDSQAPSSRKVSIDTSYRTAFEYGTLGTPRMHVQARVTRGTYLPEQACQDFSMHNS